MKRLFNRRRLIAQGLTLSPFVVGGPKALLAAGAKALGAVASRPLNVQEFMILSQFISEKSELNTETGTLILKSLNQDPSHRSNLREIFALVSQFKVIDGDSRRFLISHNLLKDTYREVLRAWYLGTRLKGKKMQLFSYSEALMYRALEGIRNVPAICGGSYNFWADPPTVK